MRHVQHIVKIISSQRYHHDITAHAMLQYALCLFSGFGIGENIDDGLKWFLAAAQAGSRQARSVVHRLFRSYGIQSPNSRQTTNWLVREAEEGSQWALEELRIQDNARYVSIHRNRVFNELKCSANSSEIKALLEPTILELEKDQSPDSRPSMLTPQAEQFFSKGGLSWATCFGDIGILPRIYHQWSRYSVSAQGFSAIGDTACSQLKIALKVGRADVAHKILDWAMGLEELKTGQRRNQPFNLKGEDRLLYLLDAIPDQHIATIVHRLVSLGVDPNAQLAMRKTEDPDFQFATGYKELGQHCRILAKGFSMTPLRWAIIKHRHLLVKALLDHGARFPKVPDVETYSKTCPSGFSPEFCTVSVLDEPCYDVQILQLFFESHSNVLQTVFSETPLGLIVTEPDCPERRIRLGELACAKNLFEVLDFLRRYQPGSEAELFHAAAMNGHLDIVKYMLNRRIDIELRCFGLTPLHTAVLYGRRGIVNYLLQQGANPAAITSDKGISTAHLIFWKPKPTDIELELVSRLLIGGDNPQAKTSDYGKKVNLLHLAVLGSRIEAVRLLLQIGFDKNTVLEDEIMPVAEGARFSAWGIERSQRLSSSYISIEYHGRVEIKLEGYSALGVLIQRWDMFLPRNFLQLIRLLCPKSDHIKDFYTRPAVFQTALHIISCYPILIKTGLLEYIIDKSRSSGLHINVQDADGNTPLHYASLLRGSGQTHVIERLVRLGADPNIRNRYGMTATDIRFYGHLHELSNTEAFPEKWISILPARADVSFAAEKAARIQAGPRTQDQTSLQDDRTAKLWAEVCDGAFFKEVWDFDTNSFHSFGEDLMIHLTVGDERSNTFVDK
jgi:ankyrin repeat protein